MNPADRAERVWRDRRADAVYGRSGRHTPIRRPADPPRWPEPREDTTPRGILLADALRAEALGLALPMHTLAPGAVEAWYAELARYESAATPREDWEAAAAAELGAERQLEMFGGTDGDGKARRKARAATRVARRTPADDAGAQS